MKPHSCCDREGKYLIEYDTGSVFKVCEKCHEDKYWSMFVVSKQAIAQ
jgi:hypothetical protein